MMNIIYVVMAISLTCLIAFGGISYINPDAPIKAVASRGLYAQFETLRAGIAAYRHSNNGLTPESIDLFKGFLPHGDIPSFGPTDKGFEWSVELAGEPRPVICLTVTNESTAYTRAALDFAAEAERKSAIEVSMGDTCGSTTPIAEVQPADIPASPILTVRGF